MKGSTAMWNYDAVDKKEAERMASLYGEDATRTVEHGTEAETGELLVRSCGNELGFATWEAFDFERNTWLCEAFENREAAELWLSGEEVDTCFELDDQLVQSTKRMAALAANMSGGRWTAGIHEYKDGRKSLSFQLSDDAGFFLITSPICKTSELALGEVRDRVGEELDNLDPYREALEACRRAEDSSIALDKLAFYEKLKGEDLPVLLGALAVATEQNQRARTSARGYEIRGHARAARGHQSHGGRLRRGQGEAPGVEGERPRRCQVSLQTRFLLPR